MKFKIFTNNRLLKICKLINTVEQDREVAKMLLSGENSPKSRGWPKYRIVVGNGMLLSQEKVAFYSGWKTEDRYSYSDEMEKQTGINSLTRFIKNSIEKNKVKSTKKYIINF